MYPPYTYGTLVASHVHVHVHVCACACARACHERVRCISTRAAVPLCRLALPQRLRRERSLGKTERHARGSEARGGRRGAWHLQLSHNSQVDWVLTTNPVLAPYRALPSCG